MKFGVIVFPGSNCDRDMQFALSNDLKAEVEMIWHKDAALNNFSTEDCIVLPGGFSYGDYLRCGALARFSPIMQSVVNHANNGGKVFGVCNGFQILCEAGLLPGALLMNENQKFICKNVYIKAEKNDSLITKNIENKALQIPIAHGEGRFFAKPELLSDIENNNQVIFRYCNENGEVNVQYNPNGTLNEIAGICNNTRNVFGMMPHPERASNSILGNIDGQMILKNLMN
jgi:phosphoribosylformylglycinamidine synthase I